jgi:hypothetical protein
MDVALLLSRKLDPMMLPNVARAAGLLLLLPGLLLHCAPSELTQTSPAAEADSAQVALRRELEAVMRELEGEPLQEDPFRDGRQPDLVIVSSTDVLGELKACG